MDHTLDAFVFDQRVRLIGSLRTDRLGDVLHAPY
jgi:hypothetical protein